ncbi:cyclophilin-type peptidyl-prolyl cis-trans isomerase, putative [Bodo saltans]|uniref:Peptidyl-prolyl cis-trans isomerase n=1 Tax=Bodo saltans TaxID=75058 RepID=A0A0S4KGS8_BODSA|nr:cyclophilin-type peptidyl-prolyl cis-trans isomerase, putative [Bodo saltans]|eukprot:CUI14886.1 cyclophilin-type peptidyl-prolyl cis-trans isomerase, putative [Bodo saltans]
MVLSNTQLMSGTLSGTQYASSTLIAPHCSAWMEISVFGGSSSGNGGGVVGLAPGVVPSRAASAVYEGVDIVSAGLVTSPPVATFRLEFELWPSESPNTVKNFLNLCTESNSLRAPVIYENKNLPLSYRGTFFHKVIPGFIAQGGDLTKLLAGGANHVSSFGKPFEDENLKHKLDKSGLLAMANNGPNTNGSQFFITLGGKEELALNGRHCCFGRVVSGLEELQKFVGPHGNDRGEALRFAVVTACGI